MRRPALTDSEPLDFSLNWVIRPSSPSGVTVLRSQVSSVCSGTSDWTKIVHRSGSRPLEINETARSKIRRCISSGAYGWVTACRSTMQKMPSYSSISETQLWIAPR